MNWKPFKNIVLVLIFVFGFHATVVSGPPNTESDYSKLLLLLFGASLVVLFIATAYSLYPVSWEIPKWHENPIFIFRPLSFIQFVTYFILSHGIGSICALPFTKNADVYIALESFVVGLGLLVGFILVLKLFKGKFKNHV